MYHLKQFEISHACFMFSGSEEDFISLVRILKSNKLYIIKISYFWKIIFYIKSHVRVKGRHKLKVSHYYYNVLQKH